jgi:signal transduction histidine kinase
MLESALQILKMTGEGAVLVQKGRAVLANAVAKAALGADCMGKRVSELFGETVSGSQSSDFLAQIRLQERPYLLRVTHSGGEQVFFLRPQEELPAVLNQPFLYALRSSLMNMGMAADQLRTQAEETGCQALLESLRGITRSQYQILRQLNNAALVLDLSRDRTAPESRVFGLRALCTSILDAAAAVTPGLRFVNRCGSGVLIRGDRQLITAMLMNLLSNAIRHAKNATRISVSLLESPRSVVLAVDDDGCGIPPEELSRVFDRYRHDFSLSQMSAGPGLGLTAARMIAQLHGGTLLLESRQGHGTTLRVSLSRDGQNASLHAPEDAPCCKTEDLLTGLADCLPPDCFSERYLD